MRGSDGASSPQFGSCNVPATIRRLGSFDQARFGKFQFHDPLVASMAMRIEWRERAERQGWDVLYTPIGGRFSFDPAAAFTSPVVSTAVRRSLSQAMVACTSVTSTGTSDARFFASVITKIVQRGTSPRIFHADTAQLDVPEPDVDTLIAAVVGRIDTNWTLDPAIILDATWEAPFWQLILSRAPALCRWVTPQAWFEGLINDDSEGRRWVDFLVQFPWASAGVIEIDGSGHKQQRSVDAHRTEILRKHGLKVSRLEGRASTDVTNDTLKNLLNRREHSALRGASDALVRAVHGPAALHRFLFALAMGLERGILQSPRDWRIDLIDQSGVVLAHANIALDLLAAVDDVWGLGLVPSKIWIGNTRWDRGTDGRFMKAVIKEEVPSKAKISIRLEPFIPAHAALPDSPVVPAVVIRSCLLPVDLQWFRPAEPERRNSSGTASSLAGLDRVLADLFGFQGFREGQREAVSRLLSGGDSLVLLPTGAGKTLIYQVAGLLRPGVTIVVSPLKALIDDQERRLFEQGSDRVIGIHSGRRLQKAERQELQASIGGGEALFVLIAPERLQIKEFRDHVSAAATSFLVNLAVIDEAHCVSEWGHQFRTSYLRLGRNLRRICAGSDDMPPPLLGLTATASPRVLADVKLELGLDETDPGLMFRPASFKRPNLHYRVFQTSVEDRSSTLRDAVEWVASELGVESSRLADRRDSESLAGIVFVPHGSSGLDLGVTRFRSEMKAALGRTTDDEIAIYSGTRPRELSRVNDWETDKVRYADDFRRNVRTVMVSTNAFGMGIDKPNIRYTIHVVLPSSIEGFAQESGRAGRDGRGSMCALIAPADHQRGIEMIENRKTEILEFAKDDIGIQLTFLRDSFKSPREELDVTLRVLTELLGNDELAGKGGLSRDIPMNLLLGAEQRELEAERMRRERALFRLLNMGLLDDYTIDYGAKNFTAYFGYFSPHTLVESTRQFVDRVTGGNREYIARVESVAEGESALDVARRSAAVVIDAVYERIEPARAIALREMLVLSGLKDPVAIAERINAYLAEGPVAAMLDRVIRRESGIRDCLSSLSAITPDEYEWKGAAIRFLESFPDHPVLLAVRALGESWELDGSRAEFNEYITSLFDAVVDFGLESEEIEEITAWTLRLLRESFRGRRSSWCVDVWRALEKSQLPDSLVRQAEIEALQSLADHSMHEDEIDIVVARQVRRVTHKVRDLSVNS